MSSTSDELIVPKQQSMQTTVVSHKVDRKYILIALIIGLIAFVLGYIVGRAIKNQPQKTTSLTMNSLTLIPTQAKPLIKNTLIPYPTQAIRSSMEIAPTISLTNLPVFPTENPTLTENWKTYTNVKWGVSFNYPETWLYQQEHLPNDIGDAVVFYPIGVTPKPGDSVFMVENQDMTDEQFISTAFGKSILNVAGKPALRGEVYQYGRYYTIKITNTNELQFTTYYGDPVKSLDTIISTLKFTN